MQLVVITYSATLHALFFRRRANLGNVWSSVLVTVTYATQPIHPTGCYDDASFNTHHQTMELAKSLETVDGRYIRVTAIIAGRLRRIVRPCGCYAMMPSICFPFLETCLFGLKKATLQHTRLHSRKIATSKKSTYHCRRGSWVCLPALW